MDKNYKSEFELLRQELYDSRGILLDSISKLIQLSMNFIVDFVSKLEKIEHTASFNGFIDPSLTVEENNIPDSDIVFRVSLLVYCDSDTFVPRSFDYVRREQALLWSACHTLHLLEERMYGTVQEVTCEVDTLPLPFFLEEMND